MPLFPVDGDFTSFPLVLTTYITFGTGDVVVILFAEIKKT